MVINATVTDIEDNSLLQGVLADIYFDWGGPNEQLMENQTTGTDGIATFSCDSSEHGTRILLGAGTRA